MVENVFTPKVASWGVHRGKINFSPKFVVICGIFEVNKMTKIHIFHTLCAYEVNVRHSEFVIYDLCQACHILPITN